MIPSKASKDERDTERRSLKRMPLSLTIKTVAAKRAVALEVKHSFPVLAGSRTSYVGEVYEDYSLLLPKTSEGQKHEKSTDLSTPPTSCSSSMHRRSFLPEGPLAIDSTTSSPSLTFNITLDQESGVVGFHDVTPPDSDDSLSPPHTGHYDATGGQLVDVYPVTEWQATPVTPQTLLFADEDKYEMVPFSRHRRHPPSPLQHACTSEAACGTLVNVPRCFGWELPSLQGLDDELVTSPWVAFEGMVWDSLESS
ncbi:hypothetical protein BD410DRAFT_839298 [Rickenella mellea]|uniref:Uncharacterized protein n=1 Tax=Rickenella mellea TaxID=50990 RepID=A0A4Y7Q6Y8_9AGAM|nr:hypothetical protein BD410DRAFT_839298 [Rickenella mellea]